MGLIDSHAHLTFDGLFDDLDEVLARCKANGVEKIITIGTDLADAQAAIDLSRRFPKVIYAAAGFHPHEADKVVVNGYERMAALWRDPRVVACGEMGLDYHYDFADRSQQRTVFARQLALAREIDKPVIIHCREAFEDVTRILVEQGFEGRRVVVHCFTGTVEDAVQVAQRGWRISFTGIVTFPKSIWLQGIAKDYPVDQLMIETDSPYLSPVPIRGKHPNEPANVAHIAQFLADLRSESYGALADRTSSNTQMFFNL